MVLESYTKEDIIQAKKQFEAMRINALINIVMYENNITKCEELISGFPEDEEDKKMKEEIKKDLLE